MKNFKLKLILSVFLIGYANLSAQICGEPRNEEAFEKLLNKNRSKLAVYEKEYRLNKKKERLRKSKGISESLNLTSIPVHFIIINKSDGTENIYTETEIDDELLIPANNIFNELYLDFFRCDDVTYINDDELFDFDSKDENHLVANNYIKPNVVNVVIASLTGLGGWAYYPGGRNIIVLNRGVKGNSRNVFAHELGHFYGLAHTFNHYDSPDISKRELVNGSNCSTAGDRMCDTPADPRITGKTVNIYCQYHGTSTDENGDFYMPDTHNIMSYSRSYCMVRFSEEQKARMYAVSKYNLRGGFKCTSLSVDMAINKNNSNCDLDNLTVQFTDKSVGATSWAWDFDSDGIVDSTVQNPTHTFLKGEYLVTLTISNGSQTISKVFFDQMIFVGAKASNYKQDFDDLIEDVKVSDGWTTINSASGFSWRVGEGKSSSTITGASIDGSGSSTGIYMYTQSFGNYSKGDEALLISPCVQLSETPFLKYKYHIYVNEDLFGSLSLDISTDGGNTWENSLVTYNKKTHNSNDEAYKTERISLSDYANQIVKIRFRATIGVGIYTNVAIDNIVFEDRSFVDFSASETYGVCLNTLDVNFTDTSNLLSGPITSWEWDFNNDGVVNSRLQNPRRTFKSGTHIVKLTVSNDVESLTKVFNENPILVGPHKSGIYRESFNNFDDISSLNEKHWTVVEDSNGYTWQIGQGSTTTNGNSPNVDGDGNPTGKYMYVESNSNTQSSITELKSPCVLLGNKPVLKYNYHYYSKDNNNELSGKCYVELSDDDGETWSIILKIHDGKTLTNVLNPYNEEKIDLSPLANEVVRVRFKFVSGVGDVSNFVIDNITFDDEEKALNNKFINKYKINIHPNPVNNILNLNFPNDDAFNYEILDLFGRKLLTGKVQSRKINVSKLSKGAYILVLINEQNRIVKKFVKE